MNLPSLLDGVGTIKKETSDCSTVPANSEETRKVLLSTWLRLSLTFGSGSMFKRTISFILFLERSTPETLCPAFANKTARGNPSLPSPTTTIFIVHP